MCFWLVSSCDISFLRCVLEQKYSSSVLPPFIFFYCTQNFENVKMLFTNFTCANTIFSSFSTANKTEQQKIVKKFMPIVKKKGSISDWKTFCSEFLLVFPSCTPVSSIRWNACIRRRIYVVFSLHFPTRRYFTESHLNYGPNKIDSFHGFIAIKIKLTDITFYLLFLFGLVSMQKSHAQWVEAHLYEFRWIEIKTWNTIIKIIVRYLWIKINVRLKQFHPRK